MANTKKSAAEAVENTAAIPVNEPDTTTPANQPVSIAKPIMDEPAGETVKKADDPISLSSNRQEPRNC
jgi:hypothetical protein